ncbi:hypothetical protein G6038_09035 [Rhodococcus sp. 14C212]|uniref:DUF3566 domain-containing protein n=1 Tax=Rhodococcus sp. 14C212 TaxID=2711209 RepID=UPI0013EB777A|nr:hypothetical protein [Rhodococcus sp. 14C212]
MSTPQGPNGAEQGPPAQPPKGQNGREVPGKQAPEVKPEGAAAPSDTPGAARNPTAGTNPGAPADGATKQGSATPESGTSRPGQQRPGGPPTPPWQRGNQQEAPQNVPQTNLARPGQTSSSTGRPAVPTSGNAGDKPATRPGAAPTGSAQPAGQQPGPAKPAAARAGGNPAGGRPGAATPPTRPVVTGTAAASMNAPTTGMPGADRSAAKAKAAVIDGPTRHIERKDLAKDLPDLSTVKHPLPSAPAEESGAAQPVAAVAAAARVPGEPLRATVQLRRIDPWSMLKISSVISVSLFFVWMVAVGLLYGVLAGMGVWERLNSAFTDMVSDTGGGGLITAGQVFGYATVIGLVNTILLTALATLGAFIYNLCTDLVGGVQVTLADPD